MRAIRYSRHDPLSGTDTTSIFNARLLAAPRGRRDPMQFRVRADERFRSVQTANESRFLSRGQRDFDL